MNWRRLFTQPKRWWYGGVLSLCLMSGCSWKFTLDPDNCSTIPPGALPRPNGSSVREMMEVQAANAAQDDFVIYKHFWDYCGDGTTFGPFGLWQWNEIVRRLATVPFPVVIEPDGKHPELNEARRLVLVNALLKAGYHDAPMRVMIASPQAEGLYGCEAPWVTEGICNPPWQSHHGFHGGWGDGYNQGAYGGGLGAYGGGLWGGNGGFGGGYGSGFGSINRWNGYGVGYFNATPTSRMLQMR